ncbi:peptide deformylase [Saccharospirillum impatiens]|uniref:peptide deformylase n=1 Tax=Saccharospirillum impatiens TaxID=169438 RepID=UPI0003FFAFAE|nr:peptide deformylase [Saccharospirillum impatiens]
MALLDILEYPDPRLRTVAKPVATVDERIRTLASDMLDTMYDAPGIGLAASQVNVHERVIVVDISEEQDEPHVFVNPDYEKLGDDIEYQEGCLSVPGYYEKVSRSDKIRVKALNLDGETFELVAEDLLAICIQHEIDHLDGKLFVDYLSNLKRTRIRKKLEKQHKQMAS